MAGADMSKRPESAGLAEYLSAMRRVEKALVDLNATNLKSNQKAIGEFNSLLNTGSGKLEEMMRALLREHVTPVEPLHYLTKGMHIESAH